MKKPQFKKRYTENSAEVQEYMDYIADFIIEKHNEIPNTFAISLDLLANNLEIMVKSMQEMKETGISDDDRYHGKKKSASLQTYFQAQSYVNAILSSFGLTPRAASGIRKNKEEVNVQEFLENLTA